MFTVFGTAERLGTNLKSHNFSIYMYTISYTDLNFSFAVSAYNLLKVCSKGSRVISPYQTTLARKHTLDLSCYSSVLCECGNKELRFLLQHFFTIVLLTFYSLERVLLGLPCYTARCKPATPENWGNSNHNSPRRLYTYPAINIIVFFTITLLIAKQLFFSQLLARNCGSYL